MSGWAVLAWLVALTVIIGAVVVVAAVLESVQERRQWERNPARRVLEEIGKMVAPERE